MCKSSENGANRIYGLSQLRYFKDNRNERRGIPLPPPFVNFFLVLLWHHSPQNTVIIPQGLINVVLYNLHSSSSRGHMGLNRTTARARERFFWPHMHKAVQKFIQNCSECSEIKQDPSLNKAPLKHIEVGEPFMV